MISGTLKTVGFKPGERNVFFHLLTACNLSCSHCYINPEQHGTKTLSKETIFNWLKLFSDSIQKTNLILLGGEPTMHRDLAAVIREAKRLEYDSVTVDSNGYLFHDLLDHITPQQLDLLSFSLDGPEPAVNDPIRGQGVFKICTENLKKAVKRGFHVSVIYTVSSRNIAHLHKMPDLLAGFGVDRFFIQVIGLRGKSASETQSKGSGESFQVSPEEWLNVVPRVAEKASQLGLNVVFPKVFLEAGEEFQCAGNVAENYFIFPNNRVYQCPLCEDYPINSFEIKDNQLVKNKGLNEDRFFLLDIPEGCVMNKLLQPDNIDYYENGKPRHRIACCLLKQEFVP